MFRIVTTHIKTGPQFWMLCDQRQCGVLFIRTIEGGLGTHAQIEADQRRFVGELTQQGWALGMDMHLCPECLGAMRATQEAVRKQNESRIIVPGSDTEKVLARMAKA